MVTGCTDILVVARVRIKQGDAPRLRHTGRIRTDFSVIFADQRFARRAALPLDTGLATITDIAVVAGQGLTTLTAIFWVTRLHPVAGVTIVT